MRKHLKSLFSDSLIYGLSGIITSFIGIFLIPIYTKVFDPKDYGIIALLGTTSAILHLFITFNLDNSSAVWYWSKPETEERQKTFSSWFWFLVLVSPCIGLIFIALPGFWSKVIFHTEEYRDLLILFGINIIFVSFQKIVNIWYRMKRRPFHAVGFALLVSLVTIGLNILFIVNLKWGLVGAYTAQIISSFFGFLLCIIILHKWISPFYFSKRRLREMLVFAWPLLPASLMYWLMNSTSSYFLNFYSTKSEIGLYQIGSMVAGVFSLAVWAFMQAWGPFALSISGKEEAKQVYGNVLELYCIVGLLLTFLLAIFAEDLLRIFTNEKYLAAKYVVGILAISVLMQGIPQILSIANAITRSNISYAKALVTGAIITIVFFNIFIPLLGKEGAALSILAGNLIVPVYHARQVQKIYHIPYNFRRIFTGFMIVTVFFAVAYYLSKRQMSYGGLIFTKVVISIVSLLTIGFYYRGIIRWKSLFYKQVIN